MLQPGRLQDLKMYATASAGKHNLVSGLEATLIDYKAEDFLERVRALTDDGVDAVFDPIGGAHVARSFGTLRWGGRLVGYGLSSGPHERRQLWGPRRNDLQPDSFVEHPTNGKRATIYTIYTLKSKHPEWFREDLALLLELLAEGRIQPIVSERLPLEEVVRTHELMESAGARGKIVLLPNG
jgi:NADPH2:quinone reductase